MLARVWTLAVLLAALPGVSRAEAPPHGPSGEKQEVVAACKSDVDRLCGKVQPGEGRIKACMKQHLRELSDPCKIALLQARMKN